MTSSPDTTPANGNDAPNSPNGDISPPGTSTTLQSEFQGSESTGKLAHTDSTGTETSTLYDAPWDRKCVLSLGIALTCLSSMFPPLTYSRRRRHKRLLKLDNP